MEYKYFTINIEDNIAFFTINRPEVRNAMNDDCWKELGMFIETAEEDDDIKVIVISGAGEKAFISGADISVLQKRTGVESLRAISRKTLFKIEECRKPVIAAINGVAFGGGFEVALACDIRIVAENVKFGLPEANLGIIPGAGGTQRLSRLVGVGIAKEIAMAGRVIGAEEAVGLGMAMKCVPLDKLKDEAISVAKVMLKKGPVALELCKKSINASMYTDLHTGIQLEALAFCVAVETEDKVEGTSAFLEKRPAEFMGK